MRGGRDLTASLESTGEFLATVAKNPERGFEFNIPSDL
jgi:hypothetical protein